MKKIKRKICIVIVNRANYGRIRILIEKIKSNKNFKLQLILCSSSVLKKYGDLKKTISKTGIKPSFNIYSTYEGENLITMTKSAGHLISDLSSAFDHLKPDIVFTIGDRFETIATAITSTYLNIYLAHLQGGELSGSIDESIRHAVTKFSHLHLVATKKSKKNVIQMGEDPKKTFNVGCPSIDEIKKINFDKKINLKSKLYKGGTGNTIDLKKDYIVALFHPDTTEYVKIKSQISVLIKAILRTKKQCVFLWPNNDAGSNYISHELRILQGKLTSKDKINFYTNFKNDDYYRLINRASCLVGNSSSGIRESSYLGVPVVNIGSRQRNREKGKNVLNVKCKEEIIYKGIIIQSRKKKFRKNFLYGDGNSSDRIIKILETVKLDVKKKFFPLKAKK